MAEGGKFVEYEPAKFGSLLQHSFSTLMDDSDEDTISESRGSSQADLLDLRLRRSPRLSAVSANQIKTLNNNLTPNGNLSEPTSPVVTPVRQNQSNPVSPRGAQVESGLFFLMFQSSKSDKSGISIRTFIRFFLTQIMKFKS